MGRETERPLIMEEQHNITKKDKFILTTVLIIIFVGGGKLTSILQEEN